MGKLLAIARNTFTETIRQPVFGVLLWVAVGLLIMNPSVAAFSLESGSDIKIVKDVGLATLLLYGLLASVFSATSVITREIESHTVLTVVSKPISRPVFLLGKYLGVCAAVLVGYYFLSLVFLLTLRHGVLETVTQKYDQPVLVFGLIAVGLSVSAATFGNYVYGWHFPSTLTGWVVPLGTLAVLGVCFISPKWELQAFAKDFRDLQVIYAIAMSFCGVVVLTAFAVTLATRLSQVLTLLVCAAVYVGGLLSDYYLGQAAQAGGAWLYHVLYAIIPNFQFFWAGDALTQTELGAVIQAAHVGQVAAYAALYALAVLGVGVALFEHREVG
ncbi:MAG: ABC transporter permease subunit [Planctomycetota bacterium]